MHMADALVSPPVATGMAVASLAVGAYSIFKIKKENKPENIPVMGVMGAFVFATQMVNFTIPGTGSSGHLCGGLLLSALIGPYGGFLSMMAILLLQCLLFADGGLMAYGCNVWNMAFYACFFGYFCIYKPILGKNPSKKKILIASILGSVLSLQLGAFSVTLETLISGVTELPFLTFLSFMQPIHLAIGFVEGLITSAVLIFVYNTRPEMLNLNEKSNEFSFKKVIAILGIVTVLIGGGISLLASSSPDGLEWSMENVAGSTELDSEGSAYDKASEIQEKTAILPDYSISNSNNEILGTSFSGIGGSVLVAVILIGGSLIFRFYKKGAKNEQTRKSS